MKHMLIFLCFPFLLFAGDVTSLQRTTEHNGDYFTDSGTITFPEHFDIKKHKVLINQIGYVYPPFSVVDHTKEINHQLMFKARYQIKNYGLRLSDEKKASLHLIIAGDSNVFGEGCNEDETLTSQLKKQLTSFHTYNFGHRGGGPHNTLSLMEHVPFQNLIAEKKGIFIYDFFASHMLERVIGGKNYIAWDNGFSPWYEFDKEKNDVIFRGQLKMKTSSKFCSLMSQYRLFNWLFPVLPRITQEHISLVSKIFGKMKKEYLKAFPEGRFIVLLNDSLIIDEESKKLSLLLKEDLMKENIETLWTGFSKNKSAVEVTFKDGHFNPDGQKWQAGLISDYIKNLSSSLSVKQ